MAETIFLTIVEHSRWGTILQPLLVNENESNAFEVLEIATRNSSYFSSLSKVEQQIVDISGKYADKALMKLYSKEKITSDFLKKVTDDTILHYIRPCIENYHKQIIKLLPETQLRLFSRKNSTVRVLYDIDEIDISSQKAEALFNFLKDSDSGFRYFIQVKWNNKVIDLKDKSFLELCHSPAIVIVDQKLFAFEDIDSKKLLPFFNKSHITIPATSEKEYIEKFVVNCVKRYEVVSKGISITEIQPKKKALLFFENDWNMRPVLRLCFQYDNYHYHSNSRSHKIAFAQHENGQSQVCYFFRDETWEQKMVCLLTENGLEKNQENQFIVRKENDFLPEEDDVYALVDWLRDHQDVLRQFSLQQENKEKAYYIGEIELMNTIDSKQDWFDIQSKVLIGDFEIPFRYFRHHILEGIREYSLPNGQIAILPKEWFVRYYEIMLFGKKTENSIRLRKHHFRLIENIENKTKPQPEFNKNVIKPVPDDLNATLRPYQQKGFSWLVYLHDNHFGGCLADDMGLGKTLQTITLLQHIYTDQFIEKKTKKTDKTGQLFLFEEDQTEIIVKQKIKPSIIVVPTSLTHNWKNELQKFAPKLKVYTYSGNNRIKSKDIGKIFSHYHVVLTTYGILRNDIEMLSLSEFYYLILDESQYVKNPTSQTYKAVKQMQSSYKLILTGTPIENSLSDLWAQSEIINEGMLGNLSAFKKAYINPIVNKKNKEKETALLQLVQPFILRRTKAEVTPELPPLLEKVIFCDMSDAQRGIYLEEKNKIRSSLLSEFDNPQKSIPQNTSFIALQGLTRLRLLANHPVLLDKNYTEDSGKFEQIIMRFQNLQAEQHKVLIFSSFVKHLQILADYFDQQKWAYAWLTGSVSPADREREIAKFSQEENVNCFFISLKAGGVGLNLTAADYVFIIDPWWNPAAEMQAVARSHRIGQEKNVMVYRFISSSTIEEKIIRLQQEKSNLAETFVTSSNPLSNLSMDQLDELLKTDSGEFS